MEAATAQRPAPAGDGPKTDGQARQQQRASEPQSNVRKYTVLRQDPEDKSIDVVGDYEGGHPDDACWKAVESKFRPQAEAAGKGEGKGPKLTAVLADRLDFEEYVLEPVTDVKRRKR